MKIPSAVYLSGFAGGASIVKTLDAPFYFGASRCRL